MKVQFILLLFFTLSFAYANELEGIKFKEITSQEEWDEAFELAAKENKLVFADAYTDWCGYCKKLDKEVYTDPSVIAYFEENFINIKFDAESEFGYPVAEYYGIDGYPTLLFLTEEAKTFYQINGFVEIPQLMAYAKDAQGNWENLPTLWAQFEDGTLSKEDHLSLIGILEKTDAEKSSQVAKRLADTFTAEDYLELENIWLLSRYENGLNSRHYGYITSNKDLMIETHGASEFSDYMGTVYNENLQLAIKYGDKELLKRLVDETLPLFVEKAELPAAQYVTRSVFLAQREEFDEYKLEVNSYMNNHLASDQKPDFIMSTAVEIIENFPNDELISFANQMLFNSIGIDASRFESHALYGYTSALMGSFVKANESLNKAKSLAKTDEQKTFVENLKEAVKQMQ